MLHLFIYSSMDLSLQDIWLKILFVASLLCENMYNKSHKYMYSLCLFHAEIGSKQSVSWKWSLAILFSMNITDVALNNFWTPCVLKLFKWSSLAYNVWWRTYIVRDILRTSLRLIGKHTVLLSALHFHTFTNTQVLNSFKVYVF